MQRLVEYPNLHNYIKELYQLSKVKSTVDFKHIKDSFYSQQKYNPNGVIPKGPLVEFDSPHDRARL